ncbi:MAG: DUF1576 domain-containing protein [Lachnospiraceae bacterium]|nr:DUF1576 domain-containing protein [Lachnospiraceae bacterium]
MNDKFRQIIKGKEMKVFLYISAFFLYIAAFLLASPKEILSGMKIIICSKDALITDYFELAGYGASFFNAAMVLTIGIVLVRIAKLPFTGITTAALAIDTCFGFWGKNPVNILPIYFGVILYAKLHKASIGRYLYTALFGACLGPIVTEIMYKLSFPFGVNLVLTAIIGILIGMALPPLSSHTISMHMGYNLFNVGFSGGLLAFAIVCVMRSMGLNVETEFIWKEGHHVGITIGVYFYFVLTFFYGLWLREGKITSLSKIMKHPGRAIADFVIMDGPGSTLMNMALVGLFAESYVLLIGGDLSGPVQGAILMAFGYGAFGAHLKNYLPVLSGVLLSCLFTQYVPTTPGVQIASIFCIGLAPIAGQFGILAGVEAGILHAAIVMYSGQLYGGLNLYNNGFSCGCVAIIMVPLIESFMSRFEHKRATKKK